MESSETSATLEGMARVEAAIAQIKRGGFVIMTDDEGRENEGDLVIAAEFADAEHINFLAKEARGLICLSMAPRLIEKLDLPLMEHSRASKDKKSTAFTVSIEAREGVTTGISAADRAHTIRVAVDDKSTPNDIVVPGHIFPLRARKGGVLERAGHTEGSIDLANLAQLKSAAVICEIMNDDGTMARGKDLEQFSKKFELPMVCIADLIHYRLLRESLIEKIEETKLNTSHGEFTAHIFESVLDHAIHVALTVGEKDFAENITDVRVHAQRPLADVLGHALTGPRQRIEYGLNLLKENEHAVLLYLSTRDSVGRIKKDLVELSNAEKISSGGNSGMDLRQYGIGAQILKNLGIQKMRLHTDRPRTLKGLAGFGLEVVGHHAIQNR